MHAMSDPASLAGMLPFDSIGLYEQPKPRFIFKMPRVVPDQKSRFESEDLFKRLSRESEVRYTGYRDRPPEERQMRFTSGCREGHTEIAFTATGTNLQLVFDHSPYNNRGCDFQKENGKAHIVSRFIMNGVCVRWRGWIDLERLDGAGCLELDEERAAIEDAALRDQIERYNQRLREFEDKQRAYREHGEEMRAHSQAHIVSRFIMNGVCVRWRGWIDLERLDGAGCLELDEERAAIEDAALRDQIERYNQRLREFEDKQRAYREHGEEMRAHSQVHAQRCHPGRQPPLTSHPAHPHPAHPGHIKPHSQGLIS
ncbi:unnamed protein product [Leptidea sinapis]|uniref:Protein big brother n=1 Tax=Leptidea sinapis TaxID=189913 RepID=A0A5E4QJD8_9NEOP|nr:unnamed protein product [Leptidea sinapis]